MNEVTNKLEKLRKHLHQFPEISGEEMQTARVIVNFLKENTSAKIIENVGKTSILAIFSPENFKQTILIRCELDALPIQEINDFSHKSENSGVSHKCGHDGHMSILCGLAKRLEESKDINSRVILLYQEAEETGEGAKNVLLDNVFQEYEIDYAIALHNVPGYPKNEILCKTASFTPAVESISFDLLGVESHAAEPSNGINPSFALGEIISKVMSFHQDNLASEKYAIVTPVHIIVGSHSYGTAAGKGKIGFTVRTWDSNFLDAILKEMEAEVKKLCKDFQLELTTSRFDRFDANINDENLVKIIEKSAYNLNLNYTNKEKPFPWGEDFGLFGSKFKTAMFGLGAGENTPPLHNPAYDFPDEIAKSGIAMFHEIIKQLDQSII